VVRNWHAIVFPIGHDTGRSNLRWNLKLNVEITVTGVVEGVGALSAMKSFEAIVADENPRSNSVADENVERNEASEDEMWMKCRTYRYDGSNVDRQKSARKVAKNRKCTSYPSGKSVPDLSIS